ncbi:MAG: head-tail connector protein [Synergistaceae bacterium]|nr:head-tail connector protein [Synergistaceae bacterium]
MSEPTERRKNAERRYAQMMADRQDYEDWWRKLSDMYAPNRGRFSVDEPPRKKAVRYNSRSRQIPDDFAAGMKSGLTSPSRPWFSLTLYDTGLAELENVKAWLTEIQDIMQGVMLRSNLYDQIFDVYKEQGIFGTGALLIEEDDEAVIHAQSLTVGSYAIGVDRRGRVNRFCRQFRRTVQQLAEEFGEDALPPDLRYKLTAKNDNTRYELRNLIEPSEDYLKDEMTGRFKYVSYWWLRGYSEPEFLRIGGYSEFPVMCPRWRIINDDLYGREQPGDTGYDDAATIQQLELDERDALKKTIRPPVLVPESLTQGDIQDFPGGVTMYYPTADGSRPSITPLYQVAFDHRSVAQKRLELTAHLEEIFYVNMFKMWTTDTRMGRTATEIQAREAEKMYMLGPLIERQMSELLEPMISRIYGILSRAGKFPPPPQELEDREIKVEYMSILANIQKQAAFSGIQQIISTAGMIAQLQGAGGQAPAVLDKIDGDEIIDQLADMYAVPAGIVLGDDAVEAKRAEREQAEALARQQQQELAGMQTMSDSIPKLVGAAQTLSDTQIPDGGNGLEALAGIAGGLT